MKNISFKLIIIWILLIFVLFLFSINNLFINYGNGKLYLFNHQK
jgi:hypothetical protein